MKFHERFGLLYENMLDKDPKFSRKDLASLCEISVTMLNNYLSGRTLPPLPVLLRIANKMNTSVSWLVGEPSRLDSMAMLYPLVKDLDEQNIKVLKGFIATLNSTKHKELWDLMSELNVDQIALVEDYIGYLLYKKEKVDKRRRHRPS